DDRHPENFLKRPHLLASSKTHSPKIQMPKTGNNRSGSMFKTCLAAHIAKRRENGRKAGSDERRKSGGREGKRNSRTQERTKHGSASRVPSLPALFRFPHSRLAAFWLSGSDNPS